MEPKSQHSRVYSESDKQLLQLLDPKQLTIRRKLLETCLQKDTITSSRQRVSTKSSERLQSATSTTSQASNPSNNKGLILRDFKPVSEVQNRPKSKSPSATKRNTSVDVTAALGIRIESTRNRKKLEKPTDRVQEVAEKFTVKKAAVKTKQDLGKLAGNGDFLLCRAFISLLSEVDYHIKESQNFPIEVFFEYLTSPGIVVQTIKRLPELLSSEKLSQRKIYLECFNKSLEFFNQISEISANSSLELLLELLVTVYSYKGLSFKGGLQDTSRFSTRVYQTPRAEADTQRSGTVNDHRRAPKTPSGPKNNENPVSALPVYKIKVWDDINPGEDCMQSKTALLDKFFSKMGLSQTELTQRRQSPLKEYRNRSQDYFEDYSDTQCYIKPVKDTRSSSLTPKSSELKPGTLKEFKSNKNIKNISKTDKGKSGGVTSAAFKKIDEKFVQVLCEKMKKETLDVKKLKKTNYEEYMKKKNFYISVNKAKWIGDTIKSLEVSELVGGVNENECRGVKQEALMGYLNEESHLAGLVKKAEQLELSLRRAKKQ